MQIFYKFFAKRFTILLLYVCQVSINLQDHLHFFLHFVFSFMEQLFMDDPISYLKHTNTPYEPSYEYGRHVHKAGYWLT